MSDELKADQNDILIHLRLVGQTDFDAKFVLEALDTIEMALYASDRNDIELAATVMPMPGYVKDASLERIRHHRHHRLLLREAQSGSIELIGVVAAVSYFVLQRTLGEALKDGFKETSVYDQLRRFFQEVIDDKTAFISDTLTRAFSSRKKQVRVRTRLQGPAEPNRIIIEVAERPETRRLLPASLGEELRKANLDK